MKIKALLLVLCGFLSLPAHAILLNRNPSINRPFVLDQAGLTAAAAFSLHQLRAGYLGYCCNLRRSSDNTAINIGFNSKGFLDVGTALSFVGSGNGFVTTWYDQGGGGNNATESTAADQPELIIGGSMVSATNGWYNAQPALYSAGAGSPIVHLNYPTSIATPPFSMEAVSSLASGVTAESALSMSTGTNDYNGLVCAPTTIYMAFYNNNASTPCLSSVPSVGNHSFIGVASSTATALYWDGSVVATSTPPSATKGLDNPMSLFAGLQGTYAPWKGWINEFMLFSIVPTSEQISILSNYTNQTWRNYNPSQ